MIASIENIYNRLKTKIIYPKTKYQAVFDDNGNRLDTDIAGIKDNLTQDVIFNTSNYTSLGHNTSVKNAKSVTLSAILSVASNIPANTVIKIGDVSSNAIPKALVRNLGVASSGVNNVIPFMLQVNVLGEVSMWTTTALNTAHSLCINVEYATN